MSKFDEALVKRATEAVKEAAIAAASGDTLEMVFSALPELDQLAEERETDPIAQAKLEAFVEDANRSVALAVLEVVASEGASLKIGDRVEKFSGEARYFGEVVSVYRTKKGGVRYVVEVEPQGFQMICTEGMLRKAE